MNFLKSLTTSRHFNELLHDISDSIGKDVEDKLENLKRKRKKEEEEEEEKERKRKRKKEKEKEEEEERNTPYLTIDLGRAILNSINDDKIIE